MGKFNLATHNASIGDVGRWIQNDSLGSDAGFYEELGEILTRNGGKFSLVCRTNPFRGNYTSEHWLSKLEDFPSEKYVVESWLGTNVSYYRSGEIRTGLTCLYSFDIVRCRDLYDSVSNAFDWAPPLPDDFACFDRTGALLVFANRHESEFYLHRNFEALEYK